MTENYRNQKEISRNNSETRKEKRENVFQSQQEFRNQNLEKCTFCAKLSSKGVYHKNKFYCMNCLWSIEK